MCYNISVLNSTVVKCKSALAIRREFKMLTDTDKSNMKEFYQAVISLETEEECSAFFDDICTIKELIDISSRLQVAKLLDEGIVFNEISQRTGCSSATISRVNKCLQFGPGGYRSVLDKLKSKSKHN